MDINVGKNNKNIPSPVCGLITYPITNVIIKRANIPVILSFLMAIIAITPGTNRYNIGTIVAIGDSAQIINKPITMSLNIPFNLSFKLSPTNFLIIPFLAKLI